MRGRVIVVEDNFPIAESLKYLLVSAGFDVVGMTGDIATASSLVTSVAFDVALLDIDVHGETVAPVADAVRVRGKPVVFLSGYGDTEMLPPHLRELPRLEKPAESAGLFAALEAALATPR